MKSRLLLIASCFIGLALSPFLQGQQQPSVAEQTAMKCKLYADAPSVSPDTPFKVAVHLENVPRRTVLTAMTFLLAPKADSKRTTGWHSYSYYAPVNVERKGAAVAQKNKGGLQYPKKRLNVPEGESEFPVSIAELYWARDISSLLPNVQLFHAVQDGDYLLSAELRTDDGTMLKCRPIDLAVARK